MPPQFYDPRRLLSRESIDRQHAPTNRQLHVVWRIYSGAAVGKILHDDLLANRQLRRSGSPIGDRSTNGETQGQRAIVGRAAKRIGKGKPAPRVRQPDLVIPAVLAIATVITRVEPWLSPKRLEKMSSSPKRFLPSRLPAKVHNNISFIVVQCRPFNLASHEQLPRFRRSKAASRTQLERLGQFVIF